MKNLPLNLNLTEKQQGALLAKQTIIELTEKMNNLPCPDDEGISEYLLAHRTLFISNAVQKFGSLDQRQLGILTALLEFAEINTDACLDAKDWRPSAITGEWQ